MISQTNADHEWITPVRFVFLLLFVALPSALALDIQVPDDALTIQAGIDLAVDGDQVIVADGTYTGAGNTNLDFRGKAITVRSELGPQNCTIDCNRIGRAFIFDSGESNASILDGFTILNGVKSGTAEDGMGGAILILNASPVIRNCTVTACTAGYGGAIYSEGHSTRILSCMFLNCLAKAGGAVYCLGDNPIFMDCTFGMNSASFGGGLHIASESNPFVSNCRFVANLGHAEGGGLFVDWMSEPVIDACEFEGNQADEHGGGIFSAHDAYPRIVRCDLFENRARLGGGIFVAVSDLYHPLVPTIGGDTTESNRFENNISVAGADLFASFIPETPIPAMCNSFSGIVSSSFYVSPQPAFDVTGSTSDTVPITTDAYVSPTGDDSADGLTWESAFQTVTHACSRVAGTSETPVTIHLAEGVYSHSTTGEVFPIGMMDHVTLSGATEGVTRLEASMTSFGYPSLLWAYWVDSAVAERLELAGSRSSAVRCVRTSATFQTCDIRDNSGSDGGGMYIEDSSPVIRSCHVRNNRADRGGGMYILRSAPLLEQCLIEANAAVNGGGVFYDEEYGQTAHMGVAGCEFRGNTADVFGGGVFVQYGMPVLTAFDAPNEYVNNRAGAGSDLCAASIRSALISALNSRFEGFHLSNYYVSPQSAFDLTGAVDETVPITVDVYVSPDGDDSNTGISAEQPFKTIRRAMSQVYGTERAPVTVHLTEGIYSLDATGEHFPVPFVSHSTLMGDSASRPRFDLTDVPNGLICYASEGGAIIGIDLSGSTDAAILAMLQADPLIENCRVHHNAGAGVRSSNLSSVVIRDCDVSQNSVGIVAEDGNDLLVENTAIIQNARIGYEISDCSTRIVRSIIRLNGDLSNDSGGITGGTSGLFILDRSMVAENRGAGVSLDNGQAIRVKGSLISNNEGDGLDLGSGGDSEFDFCTINGNGGAGIAARRHDITVSNCIVWGNASGLDLTYESQAAVRHSDIQSETGVQAGPGNINADPLFTEGSLGNVYLVQVDSGQTETSPCVNAGDPSSAVPYGTTRTDHQPDAGIADMGWHYQAEPATNPCEFVGVRVEMPLEIYHPGDTCRVDAFVCMPGDQTMSGLPLFVVLDLMGEFYFGPEFLQEIDFYDGDYPPGETAIEIIEPFVWPEGFGSFHSATMYGAVLNQEMTMILGEFGYFVFGWTD